MDCSENHRIFGGRQIVFRHASSTVNSSMNVSVFLPPQVETRKLPVLYWLSGLTCTEQNFITKAGAQRYAAEYGVVIVAPDTSPRGEDVADDPASDLGQGAGFYVNAEMPPWSSHYRMYDYVVFELPALIEAHFPVTRHRSVSGHSMGGHGALIAALRNPERYCSVSAFSPIVEPSRVPWGEKAFSAYLGSDRATWSSWDACALVRSEKTQRLPLFVDQGEADPFLSTQLKPDLLETACAETRHPLRLRRHDGYDHSYYFIASFIGEHVAYHAEALSKALHT